VEIGNSPIVDQCLIDNNIFINNNIAIGSRESGGLSSYHNLIVGSRSYGFRVTVDSTRAGNWTSEHHLIYNNIFVDNARHIGITPENSFKSNDRRLDYNMYSGASTEKRFGIQGKTFYTLAEWKTYWVSFNGATDAEANSRMDAHSFVYTDSTLNLQVTLARDPLTFATKASAMLDHDFKGITIPSDGSATPGPFQVFKNGLNTITLWRGLAPLKAYELPPLVVPVTIRARTASAVLPKTPSRQFDLLGRIKGEDVSKSYK